MNFLVELELLELCWQELVLLLFLRILIFFENHRSIVGVLFLYGILQLDYAQLLEYGLLIVVDDFLEIGPESQWGIFSLILSLLATISSIITEQDLTG